MCCAIARKLFFSREIIFTARKRSCGKVMFLHLSVIHSLHRGRRCVSQHVMGMYTPLGRHSPTQPSHWTQPSPGHTPSLCTPTPETASEAGGTHPTGVHSREKVVLQHTLLMSRRPSLSRLKFQTEKHHLLKQPEHGVTFSLASYSTASNIQM